MLLNKDDCELASKYIKNTAEDENADAMCEYADLLLFLKRFIHDYPKSINQISKCADFYKLLIYSKKQQIRELLKPSFIWLKCMNSELLVLLNKI